MEIYKTIPGYPEYQASDLGNIKSVDRTAWNGKVHHKFTGRVLTHIPNGTGYFCVCLRTGGKSRRMYVHRLVAMTFHGCDNTKLEVNHIDGNRSNNKADNLEWCTRSENHFHRYRVLGRSGVNTGKIGNLNGKSKNVIAKCIATGSELAYESMNLAAENLKIKSRNISYACKTGNPYGGYTWSIV